MIEVTNLAALRNLPITTDTVYVKGYDNAGDGGGGLFLWRTETQFQTGNYSSENYGTIIKSNLFPNNQGSWVRQYEGFINVLYFGALGFGNDYTTAFQRAIDFASLNSKINPTLKGSTIFIPNGSYVISNIILKTGITLIGESIESTILYATTGADGEYMFEMERGPVIINISKLNLSGQDTLRGAFRFKPQKQLIAPFHGGLWDSRISDINIFGFKGHGVFLEGGGDLSDYLLPNQFNVFENVRVFKNSDFSNALKLTGQQGQITFLNCEFDGFKKNGTYSKGQNISIKNEKIYTSAVISFINCTCQDADYGIFIEWAENITIDNCWFENLGVAISVKSSLADPNNDVPCKSINIVNNRFANAAGFGSLDAPNNIKLGQCINISKSFVNVNNNYVAVTDTNGINLNSESTFLVAYNNTLGGVSAQGNTFQVNKLGRTFGIMQIIAVANNIIDCAGSKLVFVTGTTSVIKTIKSSINAGEYLTIRANQNSITFDNTNNIFLTLKSNLTINNGEIVTFVKIDNIISSTIYETYQLVSIMRATT